MMRKFLIATGTAIALLSAGPASAVTYIAGNDFTGFQNANGVWSYGVVGGNFSTDLTEPGVATGYFSGTDAFSTPLIGGPGTGGAGYLFFHPGQFGEVADLRFTAPTAGFYVASFTTLLTDATNCGAGCDGILAGLNSSSLVRDRTTGFTPQTITWSGSLAAGGVIDFTIDARSNYNYDSTVGLASVSAIPEASTWMMMILGFAGIGCVGYRKSCKSLSDPAFT